MVIGVYMVGGMFVHLAFNFVLYSCLALTICLISFQQKEKPSSDLETTSPEKGKALNH